MSDDDAAEDELWDSRSRGRDGSVTKQSAAARVDNALIAYAEHVGGLGRFEDRIALLDEIAAAALSYRDALENEPAEGDGGEPEGEHR